LRGFEPFAGRMHLQYKIAIQRRKKNPTSFPYQIKKELTSATNENKRCIHNKEGTCVEILTGTDNTNNSNKLSSSIFSYLQAHAW